MDQGPALDRTAYEGIDEAHVGVALLEAPALIYRFANDAYAEMSGRQPLLGRPFAEVTPNQADELLPQMRRVLETGAPFQVSEVTVDTPAGTAYLSVRYDRVKRRGKAYLRIVVEEVTEQLRRRERREREASASEFATQMLQSIISAIPDPVAVFTRDGMFLFATPALFDLLGLPPEEVLGKHIDEVVTAGKRQKRQMLEEIHRCLESCETLTGEQQVVTPGGPLWMERFVTPVPGSPGMDEMVVVTFRDVTGRKAEADRLQEEKRLEQALTEVEALIHSTLDPAGILERTVGTAGEAVGSDSSAIIEYHGGQWTVTYTSGLAEEFLGEKLGDEDFPVAAETRKRLSPVFTKDLRKMDNPGAKAGYGIAGLMDVPLIVRGEFVGVLAFHYHKPHEFSPAEVEFGRKIAQSLSLALQNANLYEEQKRIAETLQQSLIPDIPPIRGVEVGVAYKAAHQVEQVGGDFYDMFEIDDNLVAVVIGDVSGKGIKAAGLTETIRSSIRTLSYMDPSPAFVFTRLNQSLIRQLPVETFATATYLVLNRMERTVRASSAGHPQPVLCDGACKLLTLPPDILLGAFEHPYQETFFSLRPASETLVLYTDGIIEARGKSGLFGHGRLLRALRNAPKDDLQVLVAHTLSAATRHAQGRLRDDAAVLALRLTEE